MSTAPLIVTRSESGCTLAALLKSRLRLSWAQARQLVAARRVRVNRQTCADAACRLRSGQQVEVIAIGKQTAKPIAVKKPGNRKQHALPDLPPAIAVVYADDAVAVVEKPAGLTTMRHATEAAEFGPRGRRFLPKTLADFLPRLLPGGGRIRAVHRIDRDTSGLVVFARSLGAEEHLGRQFRAHTVTRRYLAIARGRATSGRIESWLARDRGDGRRGSGPAGQGQHAVTHVRVVEELGPCTLIECRLETGRTHQVRIHLGEAGTPLAGETVYDRPVHGKPWPDASAAPRLALHATALGFTHPISGAWLEWHSPLPPDLSAVVQRLRSSKTGLQS